MFSDFLVHVHVKTVEYSDGSSEDKPLQILNTPLICNLYNYEGHIKGYQIGK